MAPDPEARLCFLAGTRIAMRDGVQKSIEHIRPGDIVTSVDAAGNLVPGRVVRVFQNEARHILDLHGTGITPGHATLCGDGPLAGRYLPIVAILRADAAIVAADGTLIRAATGCAVGADGDRMVRCVAGPRTGDDTVRPTATGELRLGTRVVTPSGRDVSILEILAANGATVGPDGLVRRPGETEGAPFHWPFGDALPKPEDYVLARSGVTLAQIDAADAWPGHAAALAPSSGPRRPGITAANVPLALRDRVELTAEGFLTLRAGAMSAGPAGLH